MLLLYIIITLILLLILMLLSWLISYKSMLVRDKLTPFECGFDPLMSHQVSFYISFYLFSLVFLVFDVEIVLLLPIILVMKGLFLSYLSIMLFMYFMVLLAVGVYIEWLDCSLDWSV